MAILIGLHSDATMDVAVEMGNCHCYDRLQMVAVIVAQSVTAQIEHHVVHLVEWQMALVKFEKSLVAEVIVAGLLKVNHYLYIASVVVVVFFSTSIFFNTFKMS